MMNTIVLICLTLLSVFGLRAQNGGEEMVKNTIDSFFFSISPAGFSSLKGIGFQGYCLTDHWQECRGYRGGQNRKF